MAQTVLWVKFVFRREVVSLPVLIMDGGRIDFDATSYIKSPARRSLSQSRLQYQASVICNLAKACKKYKQEGRVSWDWSEEIINLHMKVLNGSAPGDTLYKAREFIAYMWRHGLIDASEAGLTALRQVALARRRCSRAGASKSLRDSVQSGTKPFTTARAP